MRKCAIILFFALGILSSNAQCPNVASSQSLSVCSGVGFNYAPTNGGGNTVPAGTTYTWTIASNPNIAGEANQTTPQTAVSQTLTHTSNSPVVLSYTVTPVLATCPTTSFTLVVTVNPVPVVVSSNLNVCSGNSFTVSPTNGAGNVIPTVTNYTWTASNNSNVTGEGNQATSQPSISQTLTNTTNVNQTVNYTVTPQSGACSGSTFTIAVTVNPEATIASTTTTICSGDSFAVSPTNGSGNIVPSGTNYTWIVAANGNVTGEGNQTTPQSNISQTLTNTTNVNQTINYTITPQSGTCPPGSSFAVAVTVNPEASIGSTTATICSGNLFTVTPTNGSGNIVPSGTNYTWTAAANGNVTGESNQTTAQSVISQTLTNTTNVNQTVSYTVSPQSGTCTGTSFAIAVAVSAKPTVTLNLQETICSEQQFTFTPQNGINGIVPANTTLTWTVSNSNVNGEINNTAAGVNTISQTLANTNYANNQVVYQVTPVSNSCPGDPFVYTVIVNKAPNLIVTPTYSICQGNSVQIFAIDAFNSGQLIFNWSNSSTLNNAFIFNPIATPNATTAYTVSVTDNTTQCQVSRSINVNVSPLPTATITALGSTNICQGNSVVLNANTGAGLSYQWRVNDVAIPNATSSTYTANSAGIYSLVVTNANGCIKTSIGVTVNVNSLPVADISSLSGTSFCEGQSVFLNTTNVIGNTYQWKLNGVSIPNATASGFNAAVSGNYSVTVLNSATQCSNTSPLLLITVNPLPSASINPQGGTVCQGGSVTLQANSSAGLSYQWKVNDIAISGATSSAFNAISSGIYSVVVTNTNGCSKISNGQTVVVNPLPIANVTNLSTTTFCQGESVFFNTTNVAGNTYQWKLNGVNILGADSYSFEANQTGSYSVIVTNANSCSALSPGIDVFVNPLPEVNISAVDSSLCFGQSTAILATGASTYSWTPAELVSNSTIANPNVFPTSTTNFGVTGTDQNGCTDYSEIQITVVPNPTLDLPGTIEACLGSMVSLPGSASLAWTGVTSTTDFNAEQSGYAIATLQNSNFCSSTDSIYIQVNLLPLPNISGSISVCANSYYSEYTVNSTGNLFSWNVSNGEFQGVDNGNTAIIHWFDQEYGPSTFVTVTEHDIHSGCDGSDTLFVAFTGLAPNSTVVNLLYPNGSTLFAEDHFAIMNWGSTIISNNVNEYTDGHAQYYTFDNFDTALRYYWIEAGDDSLCLTRSYFNAPVWQVGVQEITENSLISIYPNPTSGILNLSVDTKNSISSFSIYNGTGHLVKQEFNFKNQSVIDVSDLSSGFYILKANDSRGSNYNKTFVKQ